MCHRLHDLRAHPWPARQSKQASVYTWRGGQGWAAAGGQVGARQAGRTRARERYGGVDVGLWGHRHVDRYVWARTHSYREVGPYIPDLPTNTRAHTHSGVITQTLTPEKVA